ncbi:MAG TPA: DUF4440 domain-containing protein [Gemmatimonadota bacterium]|nr:DUF4440 domain-containing protein [Gemmatimonadota bacterium]
MSRFLAALIALTVSLGACAQDAAEEAGSTEETPATDAATVEASIRASADAFEQAMLAGDVETLSSMYAADAILLPANAPRVDGLEGIRDGFTEMMAAGAPTAFSLDPATIVVADDASMAYEVGTFSWTGPGPDGTEVTDTGKYVVVWEPDGDTWKIAVDTWNSDAMPGAPAAVEATEDETT